MAGGGLGCRSRLICLHANQGEKGCCCCCGATVAYRHQAPCFPRMGAFLYLPFFGGTRLLRLVADLLLLFASQWGLCVLGLAYFVEQVTPLSNRLMPHLVVSSRESLIGTIRTLTIRSRVSTPINTFPKHKLILYHCVILTPTLLPSLWPTFGVSPYCANRCCCLASSFCRSRTTLRTYKASWIRLGSVCSLLVR